MSVFTKLDKSTASPNISVLNYSAQLCSHYLIVSSSEGTFLLSKTNNSDSEASFNRQKLPETTKETQDLSKFD